VGEGGRGRCNGAARLIIVSGLESASIFLELQVTRRNLRGAWYKKVTRAKTRGVTKGRRNNGDSTMPHRTQRRGCSMLLTLLVIASLMLQDATATSRRVIRPSRRRNDLNGILHDVTRWRRRRLEEQDETSVDCNTVGVCEMCTDVERAIDGPGCEQTGRHIKYKCTTSKGGESFGSHPDDLLQMKFHSSRVLYFFICRGGNWFKYIF